MYYYPIQRRMAGGVMRQFGLIGTIVYDREEFRNIGIDEEDVIRYNDGDVVPVYRVADTMNDSRHTMPLWGDWWHLYDEITEQIVPIPSNAPDNSYQGTTQGATTMTMHTFTVENSDGVDVEVQIPMYPEYEHAWLNVVMNWSGACYSGKSDFIRDMMDNTRSDDQLYLQNQKAVEMVAEEFSHCLEDFVEHLGGTIVVPEPEQWHPKCGDLLTFGPHTDFYVVLRGSGDDYKTPLVSDERDCEWFWVGVRTGRDRKVSAHATMSWGTDSTYYTKVED